MIRHTTTLSTILAASLLAGGCTSDPAEVSDSEYREVREAHSKLMAGSPKKDVLATFDDANAVMLTQGYVEKARVEEWKIEAKKGDKEDAELFVTFLYFADDKLIEVRDKRWDYRTDASLPAKLKK